MGHPNQEILARARVYVSAGDYRKARETIREMTQESGLSTEELVEKKRILAMIGIDPYMTGIVAITFMVWLFLLIKYAL